jgi:hypothetical protein
MPRDLVYPAPITKNDPLVTEHVKIRKSVLKLLDTEGKRRQRFRPFLIREVLDEWAARYQAQLDKEAAEAAAAERGSKKRGA